jgi:hypothetical protein
MGEIDTNLTHPVDGFDPLMQTEKIAFDRGQLVDCASCSRRNPPSRLSCLYCGAPLDVERLDVATIDQRLRRPDPWELGFSVVSTAGASGEPADLSAVANLVSLEIDDLRAILSAPVALPICRLESEPQASAVQKLLADSGVESTVVSDTLLAANKPPVRLAGIEFRDSDIAVTTFNTREQLVIPLTDVVLLLKGTIAVSNVDQMEKRKGGKGYFRGDAWTVFDDPILDIYSKADATGYRIVSVGFDFSCLRSEKALTSAENFEALIKRLSAICHRSKTITDFASMRELLGRVWEVEIRRESKGLQVTGFGKRDVVSVLSTSNLEQFTKFSRLQRYLYEIQT